MVVWGLLVLAGAYGEESTSIAAASKIKWQNGGLLTFAAALAGEEGGVTFDISGGFTAFVNSGCSRFVYRLVSGCFFNPIFLGGLLSLLGVPFFCSV